MKHQVPFHGRIFVAGCGSVSQCMLPILLKELAIDPTIVTVMDFIDPKERISALLEKGMRFVEGRITPQNYEIVLQNYLSEGDIFIDLAWNLETTALLEWCRARGVRYINSSVEEWDPYANAAQRDPRDFTLYARQMKIRQLMAKWGDNKGPTAILDHGANPGLVSHFTKQALEDMTRKAIEERRYTPQLREKLEAALWDLDFPKMAQHLGVKTIHISERDSQITNLPKQVNEFVNTWSIDGLYEEGIAPSELGWGTHERHLPPGILFHEEGPQNQVCLTKKGMDTFVRSFVPSGEIIGMVIRHGEAFGISDRLTVWENDRALYRPTVHYAYCVSDVTVASLHELKMRQLEMQPAKRILNNEIVDGKDELGCLLMGHEFGAWWMGSLLDIHEARRLVPGQNATTVQVAISVVAAVGYLLNHPQEGICLPDDMDHREILNFCKPYLGPMVSQPFDWSPLARKESYLEYEKTQIAPEDAWQFTSFLV